MSAEQQITIDEYAMTLIRVKARQLVGKYGYTKSDREDIEQDLALELHVKLRRFDARRARRTTFVSMVINRTVAGLIRQRRAASRGLHVNCHSLDENSAADATCSVRTVECGFDFAAEADTRLDLHGSLAALPADLREMAEHLLAGGIAEVARRTGRSRESIRHALRKLRRHLEAGGLGDIARSNHSGGRLRK